MLKAEFQVLKAKKKDENADHRETILVKGIKGEWVAKGYCFRKVHQEKKSPRSQSCPRTKRAKTVRAFRKSTPHKKTKTKNQPSKKARRVID